TRPPVSSRPSSSGKRRVFTADTSRAGGQAALDPRASQTYPPGWGPDPTLSPVRGQVRVRVRAGADAGSQAHFDVDPVGAALAGVSASMRDWDSGRAATPGNGPARPARGEPPAAEWPGRRRTGSARLRPRRGTRSPELPGRRARVRTDRRRSGEGTRPRPPGARHLGRAGGRA